MLPEETRLFFTKCVDNYWKIIAVLIIFLLTLFISSLLFPNKSLGKAEVNLLVQCDYPRTCSFFSILF